MSTCRRVLRGADNSHPYWVTLPEGKCVGQNFHKLRDFCDERFLSLSRHGHSVVSDGAFYQVFMFAQDDHAELFRHRFGGERMQPSQKGRGTHWALWNKETFEQKTKKTPR